MNACCLISKYVNGNWLRVIQSGAIPLSKAGKSFAVEKHRFHWRHPDRSFVQPSSHVWRIFILNSTAQKPLGFPRSTKGTPNEISPCGNRSVGRHNRQPRSGGQPNLFSIHWVKGRRYWFKKKQVPLKLIYAKNMQECAGGINVPVQDDDQWEQGSKPWRSDERMTDWM